MGLLLKVRMCVQLLEQKKVIVFIEPIKSNWLVEKMRFKAIAYNKDNTMNSNEAFHIIEAN